MKNIIFILLASVSLLACKKDSSENDKPAVLTLEKVGQTLGDPSVYADISYSNLKCASSPETGVVWATKSSPTISDHKVPNFYICPSAGASGNIELKGVSQKTLIYARAYSLTPDGVMYSNELSYTTK